MSTDERIVALEQGLLGIQRDFFVHLSENNRQMATLNKVISAQELNGRDVDHNLGMLLGIASGQGIDIKAARADLSVVKERVESIEVRLDGIERRVTQGFTEVGQRFDALEKRFDQVLQVLSTLVVKPDQEA
jgi:tetrahydromethanopterin S-methyltransferase subunit G